MTIRFDLGHDLDLWIIKITYDLDLWPYGLCWRRIFMLKFWNSRNSEWEARLTLNKVVGSKSFMNMTVTIWWPRSGVRIYNIVTGVTSDVGVPPIDLFRNMNCLVQLIDRIRDVYFLVYQKTLFVPCDTIYMLSGNVFRPLRYDTRDTIVFVVETLVCNADLFIFQDCGSYSEVGL